jgi:hypothetical protein
MSKRNYTREERKLYRWHVASIVVWAILLIAVLTRWAVG